MTPHKSQQKNALKAASKKALQKTAEATGDLLGNKIAGKITRVASSKFTAPPQTDKVRRQRPREYSKK